MWYWNTEKWKSLSALVKQACEWKGAKWNSEVTRLTGSFLLIRTLIHWVSKYSSAPGKWQQSVPLIFLKLNLVVYVSGTFCLCYFRCGVYHRLCRCIEMWPAVDIECTRITLTERLMICLTFIFMKPDGRHQCQKKTFFLQILIWWHYDFTIL